MTTDSELIEAIAQRVAEILQFPQVKPRAPEFLTQEEAAALLTVGVTEFKSTYRPQLSAIYLGKREGLVRFAPEEVHRLAKNLKIKADVPATIL